MQQSHLPAHPGWSSADFFPLLQVPSFYWEVLSSCCWASSSAHGTPPHVYPNTTKGRCRSSLVPRCSPGQPQRWQRPRFSQGALGKNPQPGETITVGSLASPAGTPKLKASGEVNLCTYTILLSRSGMLPTQQLDITDTTSELVLCTKHPPQSFSITLGWGANSLRLSGLNFKFPLSFHHISHLMHVKHTLALEWDRAVEITKRYSEPCTWKLKQSFKYPRWLQSLNTSSFKVTT